MIYSCKRCGYETEHKQNLMRHLRNKTPCQALLCNDSLEDIIKELTKKQYNDVTFDCEYCKKVFNNRSSMYRHMRICKIKTEESRLEVSQLKTQIDELKSLLSKNINVTQNTNNGTINNTHININLRDFGNENMMALSKEIIGDYFLNLQFRDLLENLHCDPDFPENQNVRIKSIKRKVLEIYKNNKWNPMTFVNGLNELLLQGHKIFKEYYKKNKESVAEEMTREELEEILNKLNEIENLNVEYIKPIHTELELMLESNRPRTMTSDGIVNLICDE